MDYFNFISFVIFSFLLLEFYCSRFQDGIYLPYENVLNYESFAVRIREDEIPNLIHILRVCAYCFILLMKFGCHMWMHSLMCHNTKLDWWRVLLLLEYKRDWSRIQIGECEEDLAEILVSWFYPARSWQAKRYNWSRWKLGCEILRNWWRWCLRHTSAGNLDPLVIETVCGWG